MMEKIVKHPHLDTQEELLHRYCKEAEILLIKASDINEAIRIKDEACKRLQWEYNSSIFVNATKDYVNRIIERKWKKGMKAKVERTTRIEDLINTFPGALRFLIEKNIPCLVCGETVWGTFEEVAQNTGLSNREIVQLVNEMNALLYTSR